MRLRETHGDYMRLMRDYYGTHETQRDYWDS